MQKPVLEPTVNTAPPNPVDNFYLLERFLKGIPLFSGYLLFLGIASAIPFYRIFRINIQQYITLSEAVLFSLDAVIIIAVSLVVYIFVLSSAITEISEKDRVAQTNKLRTRVLTITGPCLLILFAITMRLSVINKDNAPYYRRLFDVIFIDIGILILIVTFNNVYKDKIQVSRRNKYFLYVSLALTSGVVSISIQKALLIKYLPSDTVATVTMKDHVSFQTSDSLVYVGKVEKYFFFYNKQNKEAEIISASEVIGIKWVKKGHR